MILLPEIRVYVLAFRFLVSCYSKGFGVWKVSHVSFNTNICKCVLNLLRIGLLLCLSVLSCLSCKFSLEALLSLMDVIHLWPVSPTLVISDGKLHPEGILLGSFNASNNVLYVIVGWHLNNYKLLIT
jgi:hypothetical protein